MSDLIVKNLSFGNEAKDQIFKGIDKLTKAVSSTLGASGKCVIMEDSSGNPIITKDGVTVADSIVLRNPIENMGATLLAYAILEEAYKLEDKLSIREIKDGINNAVKKVIDYLKDISVPVKDNMIDQIATISTNNDKELGKLIADAFRSVGETGIVMMESSALGATEVEMVEGVEYEKGYAHANLINNKEKNTVELDNTLVLIMESKVDSIRQIQPVLEYIIKGNKSLLIIGEIDTPVLSALVMNKMKGNIKAKI